MTGWAAVCRGAPTLRRVCPHTHLNKVQHRTERGTLAPAVGLGPVLVTVRGQGAQGAAEGLCVLIGEVLLQWATCVREQEATCCWLSAWGCLNPSFHEDVVFLSAWPWPGLHTCSGPPLRHLASESMPGSLPSGTT